MCGCKSQGLVITTKSVFGIFQAGEHEAEVGVGIRIMGIQGQCSFQRDPRFRVAPERVQGDPIVVEVDGLRVIEGEGAFQVGDGLIKLTLLLAGHTK